MSSSCSSRARLQLFAVIVERLRTVRQPRRHVVDCVRQIVAMRMIEMAKQIGQRRHLPVDHHQMPARVDEGLPLIVPCVADDAILDAVETVAECREFGHHAVERLADNSLDQFGRRAELA
jgi:hypothetical protein